MMPRYIKADALIDDLLSYAEANKGTYHEEGFKNAITVVEDQPTADVVEMLIEDITKRISERLIQFLEENYEIIPKKPAVRCKDCVHRHQTTCPFLIANAYKTSTDDDFCSRGERRIDVKNEEVDLTKMRVNIEKTWNVLREAKRRDDD